MPLHLATFLHTAAVALGLLTYVLVTRAGRQRRHPSAAFGWVISIVAFPYLAIPLFLLIGKRKAVRPARARPTLPASDTCVAGPRWASSLSARMAVPPPRGNRRIAIFAEGHLALEALLSLIDAAQVQLDACSYVFADDLTGRRVAQALIAASRRGVRVRVLLDAIGSSATPRSLRRSMSEAGVAIRWFMPLFGNPLRGRTNLRNHRKLVVADRRCLWSGGRNVANEYFVAGPGSPAWLDLSFIVDGALAQDAQQLFDRDWPRLADEALPPVERPIEIEGDVPAQLIASGPDHADDVIYSLFLTAIHQAQTRLIAASPYFVPDDGLLEAMVIACLRGVRLTLLLPCRSNHRLADLARERSLRELAQAGAEILLLPDMLHAKLLIVDQAAAFCGSVNLDGRSLFLNYELTTAFYGPAEISALSTWFAQASAAAKQYSPRSPAWTRDIAEGVVRAIGFQL